MYDSQLWSDLLWKSGGGLELLKCTYHFWQYIFTLQGKLYLQGGQIGPTIEIRRAQCIVPYISSYNAYKTLGCYKSPSGTQETQYKILLVNCLCHVHIVLSHSLSHHMKHGRITLGCILLLQATLYLSVIFPQANYTLLKPNCFLPWYPNVDITGILAIILYLAWLDSTEQVFAHLIVPNKESVNFTFFVKHWTHPLEPGQLLRIAVSWAQHNVGVSYSIFDDIVSFLLHFESKWLKSIHSFLHCLDAHLHLNTSFLPKIQCTNDTCIMDHILQSKISL